MTFRRTSMFRWLIALLALVPALLFAYLGQFSRMMSDDYCQIALGKELGAWDYMIYKLDTWAGSYANWFFKGAVAPLDTLLPRMTPTLIIALWLLGLCWLVFQGLGYLRIGKPRGALAVTISAFIIAAAVHAFYSLQSFYWYAASTLYTLPLALLTIYMALAIWTAQRLRKNLSSLLAVIAGGMLCFISAGTAEVFVIFQLTLLAACLLMSLAFLCPPVRRSFVLVFAVGSVAMLASLAVQLNSPGIANRVAFNEKIGRQPIRSIPALLSETLDRTFGYIGHAEAFAGFVLLLGLGLFVMLVKYRPQEPPEASKPRELSMPILWFGLIVQLIWLPILWGHISDDPQLFGRFSIKYMMVIAFNAASILSFLIMLWQRERINAELRKHKRGLFIIPKVLPLFFVVLFALTQSRNFIHFQALIYLFMSVFMFLVLLAWQLSSLLPSASAQRFGALAILSSVLAWILIAVLVATPLFGAGYVRQRTLTFVSYLLVLPGLVWGGYIGYLLKNYAALCQTGQTWLKLLKFGSLALVVIIAMGIVLNHTALIPNFQLYASEWDARHEQIIAMRESGQTAIEVAPLTFDLMDYMRLSAVIRANDPYYRCAERYYAVDSILVSDP